MSKKGSRSKKGDGNVPNFVFKFGSDAPASPSFNFSGSAPASPSASSTGFNFNSSNPGSPASTTFSLNASSPSSSQNFQFGEPAKAAASPSFSFNSPSGSFAPPAPFKRGISDINAMPQPDRSSLRRANSEMTFGSNNTTNATTQSSPHTFTFDSPSAALSTTAPAATLGSSAPKATFTFNSPTTPAFNKQLSTNSVGSSASVGSNVSLNATVATSPFAFSTPGAPTANPTNTSAAPSTPTAASASPFSFNPPKVNTPTTGANPPSSPFSFGSPATNSAAPATPTTSATATPTFSFNKPATTTTATTTEASKSAMTPPAISTSTVSFSFGAPSTSTATPNTSAAATGTSTATNTTIAGTVPAVGFSFGSKTTEASKPATTISFGAKPTDDKANTTTTSASTPSLFGASAVSSTASTSSTSAATTVPKLSFGSTDTSKDKDTKPAVTSTPFTFGASASTATAAAATTTAPAAVTVNPSKPNPFSFEKILEDLAKVAAQPPSQVYASLITPALAATIQQSQTVNHTSFRIDNIMSTTRFSELPEQAQKELDELEKYIKMESQRCEYIGNQKMPKHLDAMANARKNTELLSQQLDALSSTLKGQMASVESFYDAVKEQLRHANDGCAVIEACKHPGNNARWLFGYSEDDDYFSQLAKQLSGRVEEYKRCIWEIERTAESWAQNKVQSPQDIADIMRNQNQAFLALSNKVASLHESVNMEKNHYHQYLQMYS